MVEERNIKKARKIAIFEDVYFESRKDLDIFHKINFDNSTEQPTGINNNICTRLLPDKKAVSWDEKKRGEEFYDMLPL